MQSEPLIVGDGDRVHIRSAQPQRLQPRVRVLQVISRGAARGGRPLDCQQVPGVHVGIEVGERGHAGRAVSAHDGGAGFAAVRLQLEDRFGHFRLILRALRGEGCGRRQARLGGK